MITKFKANITTNTSTSFLPIVLTKGYLPRSSIKPLQPITRDSTPAYSNQAKANRLI